MFSKKKPLQIKRQTVTVPAKSVPEVLHAHNKHSLDAQHRKPLFNQHHRIREKTIRKPLATHPKRKKLSQQHLSTPDFGQGDEGEDEDAVGESSQILNQERRHKEIRNRCVRSLDAYSVDHDNNFAMVHAAHIPSLDKSTRYEPIFAGLSDEFKVELQYPSFSQRESYLFVRAANDSQGFDPVNDIVQVMYQVIEHFIPNSEKSRFSNESNGFPQRLIRAVNKHLERSIEQIVGEWNAGVMDLCENGTVAAILDSKARVDPFLAERIMNQTHARTVSLNLKWLHKYEAGTDNVYGELLPKFVSQILSDTQLQPDQVFVDLGSGVGNVVLQVALESGCESWGCEIMEKYCDVATLQRGEFIARCRLWGISPGDTHLEQGDFLVNKRIHEALRRADVVLVNNQVFTPQLNEALTTLFLDLKDGCQIVSLKSFVPAGHKISARNLHSPYNVLQVEGKEYFSKCVSWTDQGGKYFVSSKDSLPLRRYLKDNQ